MAALIGHQMAVVGQTTDVHTVALNLVGSRAFDKDGNEYIYLAGVASTAAGDWVFYSAASGATTRTTSNTAATGPLAVACAATVASTFGWYQVFGLTPATTNIGTDAAADGKSLSNGAGANGRLITGPTTTKNVFGAVCVGASASNAGKAYLTYPFMFGTATI